MKRERDELSGGDEMKRERVRVFSEGNKTSERGGHGRCAGGRILDLRTDLSVSQSVSEKDENSLATEIHVVAKKRAVGGP